MESVGVNELVIEHGGLRVAGTRSDRVEYPCEYPPRIEYGEFKNKIVYDRVYRWRLLPDAVGQARKQGNAVRRFGNPTEDQLVGGVMPTIYTPDFSRLRSEVQLAGGTLKLFEGDKDTWTAWAAGWLNSAGLFAASSHIDHTLLDVLRELDVRHVDFYPDGDFAGLSVAEKMVDLFEKSSIHLKVHSMRMYVGDVRVKDTSDIWMAVGQDPSRYKSVLKDLSEMKLASRRQRELAQDSEFFLPGLYDLIESEIASRSPSGKLEFSQQGWAKQAIPCPFHDHEHDDVSPAFYWHQKKRMGYCHKRGEQYLAKDVADALGINWRSYVNNRHERSAPPSIKTPDAEIQNEKDKKEQTTPTMLNLGTAHMQHIMPLVDQYDEMPMGAFGMTLDEALEDFEMRFEGQGSSDYPPIEMPIKAFHHLGGMGRVIQPPAMIGLLGASGGFKSSFLTTMVNRYALKGYNVMVWSPEWSPERNADRIVQQFGGIPMWKMSMHERYNWEQRMLRHGAMPADDDSLFGDKASLDTEIATKFALGHIRRQFTGKVVYLKDFSPTVYHLAAQVLSMHRRMTENGYPPHILIIDYAQMALAPTEARRYWGMEDTITVLKSITLQKGLATFVASQVRKADTEAIIAQKGYLGSTSGLNLRDQQFNFFFTITPVPPDIDGGSVVLPGAKGAEDIRRVLRIAVVKNSLGKTANDEESLINFYVDTKRMVITNSADPYDRTFYMDIDSADLQELEESDQEESAPVAIGTHPKSGDIPSDSESANELQWDVELGDDAFIL